jgi:hypothetical protein
MEDVSKFLQDPKTHQNDSSSWPQWYRDNTSSSSFKSNVMKYVLQL